MELKIWVGVYIFLSHSKTDSQRQEDGNGIQSVELTVNRVLNFLLTNFKLVVARFCKLEQTLPVANDLTLSFNNL